MGKINVLNKEIFNLIAAGEVVEKPASVVKELVENSIDAGATHITIEVKNGGKYIRVCDDGSGIEKDDLTKAFLPHATSKIATKDDLLAIGTLGFRGEALSSIAAVSKVTMLSKVKNNDGNRIIVHGGEVQEIEPIGCTDGTIIIVEDLFYNVPARNKFLRKDRQEESDITNYVSRLILSKPHISIKYTLNDKVVYQSTGTNLYDAIYTIYGKSIVDNISSFEYNDDTFKIHGYIGNPTFSKPNKTYQTLLVNGRYVINSTISLSIYKAYENFIMKGTFPFFVLNIDIPLDKVDVNVHPNKLDIKFDDNNKIFGIMYSIISTKLYDIHAINTVGYSENDTNSQEPEWETSISIASSPDQNFYAMREDTSENIETKEDHPAVKEVNIENDSLFKENLQTINNLLTTNNNKFSVENNNLAYTLAEQLTLKQKEVLPKIEVKPELALNINDFKIKGTVFNTYIFVEQNETLFLIDQHAAHERLLFDKFKEQYENRTLSIQPLLVPYLLSVNEQEKSFIIENINEFSNLGFEIESFGYNTFKVNTVPLTLKNINIENFFNETLNAVHSKLVLKQTDIMWEYLAKSACRSAVKANDILSEEEIKVLLTNLSSNKDQVLLCPHGRPIILKITKTDIEKWFKRLV